MATFDGFIFSKLTQIHSKSEGPAYFLQQWNYTEIPIIKNVEPCEDNSILNKYLGKKVTIKGVIEEAGIRYEELNEYDPLSQKEELIIDVIVGANRICVPRGAAKERQHLVFLLAVDYPYRGIWQGVCPTDQLFDFFVEKEGEKIWQWSAEKKFSQVLTNVEIMGAKREYFVGVWEIYSENLPCAGTYSVSGVFLASRQEAKKEFEIARIGLNK